MWRLWNINRHKTLLTRILLNMWQDRTTLIWENRECIWYRAYCQAWDKLSSSDIDSCNTSLIRLCICWCNSFRNCSKFFSSSSTTKFVAWKFSIAEICVCFICVPINSWKRLLASSFLSVSVSASISAVPTRRIFLKFDVGNFYENPSPNSIFGWNRTTVSGTLHGELSTFMLFPVESGNQIIRESSNI